MVAELSRPKRTAKLEQASTRRKLSKSRSLTKPAALNISNPAMDAIQTLIDGNIDFEGQRLAERLTTVVLILAGLTAWLLGFFMQDLKYTLYAGLGGTVLTILIVVPPWPMYNRHPVSWLPAGSRGEEAGEKKGQ